MELSAEQTVFLTMYAYQKMNNPNMDEINHSSLRLEKEEFNRALDILDKKGYLINFHPARAKGQILIVWLKGVYLNDYAIEKAEDLIDQMKLPDEKKSKLFDVLSTAKADFKDVLAKYLAELSK